MTGDRLLSRFRLSACMRQYVLRLRLTGRDFDFGSDPAAAAAFTAGINQMRKILAKRRIPDAVANKAIEETLKAAIDHQLSQLRFDDLRQMEDQSYRALDDLISKLWALQAAISVLPPRSMRQLNSRASDVLGRHPFDTETFIEAIETVETGLRGSSPKKLAEDALSIIRPKDTEGQQSPMVTLWETMPPTTRVGVEGLLRKRVPPRSLIGWLRRVADLLDRERPERKKGRPQMSFRLFTAHVASIWRGIGLEPGLAYDGFNEHRVDSVFQTFCRAALAAIGDFSTISARQVDKAKKIGRPSLGTPYLR